MSFNFSCCVNLRVSFKTSFSSSLNKILQLILLLSIIINDYYNNMIINDDTYCSCSSVIGCTSSIFFSFPLPSLSVTISCCLRLASSVYASSNLYMYMYH